MYDVIGSSSSFAEWWHLFATIFSLLLSYFFWLSKTKEQTRSNKSWTSCSCSTLADYPWLYRHFVVSCPHLTVRLLFSLATSRVCVCVRWSTRSGIRSRWRTPVTRTWMLARRSVSCCHYDMTTSCHCLDSVLIPCHWSFILPLKVHLVIDWRNTRALVTGWGHVSYVISLYRSAISSNLVGWGSVAEWLMGWHCKYRSISLLLHFIVQIDRYLSHADFTFQKPTFFSQCSLSDGLIEWLLSTFNRVDISSNIHACKWSKCPRQLK